MAVTKKNVNGAFYFTYPSSDVFLKERNYFIFEGVEDDRYIKTVKIGNKTLNFGRYSLNIGEKFYLDVSSYYAKYFGIFKVVITYENGAGDDVTNTTAINATTYECYDPYKELIPSACGEVLGVFITPPFRMLLVEKNNSLYELLDTRSLFVPKIGVKQKWEVNNVIYSASNSYIIIASVPIKQNNFVARLIGANGNLVSRVERIAQFADTSRDWLEVKWRTRWGVDVSHIFYLDTYATDKDDAQEIESEYLYEEHSKHVIKGSFYLDNIKEPYDLWYYKTLANSELVTLRYYNYLDRTTLYFPNGKVDFNGVKITGCNIKDAVVDGVTQSTITFDFELR